MIRKMFGVVSGVGCACNVRQMTSTFSGIMDYLPVAFCGRLTHTAKHENHESHDPCRRQSAAYQGNSLPHLRRCVRQRISRLQLLLWLPGEALRFVRHTERPTPSDNAVSVRTPRRVSSPAAGLELDKGRGRPPKLTRWDSSGTLRDRPIPCRRKSRGSHRTDGRPCPLRG